TLLVVAGIHGNEPQGLVAGRRVLARIEGEVGSSRLRGDLVVLAGNREALARCQRYVGRDLNRGWSEPQIRLLRERAGRETLEGEDQEQIELLDEMERTLRAARGPRYFMDL